MGNRAQVAIKQEPASKRIYLYGHWIGSDIYQCVQEALIKAPDRHDDYEYLARVVFQTMLGDNNGTTGFGISTWKHGDLEHPLIVLDCDKQMVTFEPAHQGDTGLPKPLHFADFMALTDVAAYVEPG